MGATEEFKAEERLVTCAKCHPDRRKRICWKQTDRWARDQSGGDNCVGSQAGADNGTKTGALVLCGVYVRTLPLAFTGLWDLR